MSNLHHILPEYRLLTSRAARLIHKLRSRMLQQSQAQFALGNIHSSLAYLMLKHDSGEASSLPAKPIFLDQKEYTREEEELAKLLFSTLLLSALTNSKVVDALYEYATVFADKEDFNETE